MKRVLVVRWLRWFLSSLVVAGLVLGLSDLAAAAPAPRSSQVSAWTALLQRLPSAPAQTGEGPSFEPGAFSPDPPVWDGSTGVGDEWFDPRLRELVGDIAELSPEPEIREAAAAALAAGTGAAIQVFLDTGEPAAKRRADERKAKSAAADLAAVKALDGTGGPLFNAEVKRVLKAGPDDRAAFLAYGANIARGRDEQTSANAKDRAQTLRARVQLLATGESEVANAARLALAGDDKAVETFLATGYLAAAKKDAEAREKELADLAAKEKAAEELSELAKNAARASIARKNLMIAHGKGVNALRAAANAMVSANNEARKAEQILAANTAGGNHPITAFDGVKAEVARQLGYAVEAAATAQQASVQAGVESDILIEVKLPYGADWAKVAEGMAAAAQGVVGAAQAAQHAIDATAATDQARSAQEKAQAREKQAIAWRTHAQEHAKAAAKLAEAARVQAVVAKAAAARTKQARSDAEAATERARLAAERTKAQRQIAELEAAKAKKARAVAEAERAKAASFRAQAESQAAIARSARGQAESQRDIAAAARGRAEGQEKLSADALGKATREEGNAAAARDRAVTAEREKRAADAKLAAVESWAAAEQSEAGRKAAKAAADQARAEAGTAGNAAQAARGAANTATGAAASARAAATEATRAAARARAAAEEAAAAAARADAAADQAEADAAETHRQATQANVKATEATVQEVKAAGAAREAQRLADLAAVESAQSMRSAQRTLDEAEAAAAEAVSAATQAEASIRAAVAARASAAGIAQPTNTAISVVAPFTGTDLGADFVIEVANQAKKVGEAQAKAAETRAAEAITAAKAAEEAARGAAAQVKPAFEAAAAAANSAKDAANSSAEAQRAAAQAAVDGAAARAAGAKANQYDAQAKSDALAARNASNQANQDAAIAGRAASDAENDAASARSAASRAESDAAAANQAAAAAETHAKKAGEAAARAQTNADLAAVAAKNALNSAIAAQQASERAQAQAEKDAKAARDAAAKDVPEGNGDSGVSQQSQDFLKAMCVTEADPEACEKDLDTALKAAAGGIIEFLKENGAEIILDLIGWTDLKKCFTEGDVEACFWTLVSIIPWTKLGSVGKAIAKIVPKVSKFLEESKRAKQILEKSQKLLDDLKKLCGTPGQGVAGSSAAGQRAAAARPGAMAAQGNDPIEACPTAGAVAEAVKKYTKLGDEVAARLGYSRAKLGEVLWGGREIVEEAILARRTPEFLASVKNHVAPNGQRLTKADAEAWMKAYESIAAASSGNPSAKGRAGLLKYVVENWG